MRRQRKWPGGPDADGVDGQRVRVRGGDAHAHTHTRSTWEGEGGDGILRPG